MHLEAYRDIPPLSEMPPDYLESGHFWIQEYVVGGLLRFAMDESGLLTFGDDEHLFDSGAVPFQYVRGVEAVREHLDRDGLRAGTEDVSAYTFFGLVPLGGWVDYDWSTIPAFLGMDIWDDSKAHFAPEDVTERVFESIGLETVPVFQKEVSARSFAPGTYAIPDSALGSGPAPGVVLRKKNGDPSLLLGPDGEAFESGDDGGLDQAVTAWLETAVTADYLETLLSGTDISVQNGDIETLARETAIELSRRRFLPLRSILESDRSRFESAVIERLRDIRSDAFT